MPHIENNNQLTKADLKLTQVLTDPGTSMQLLYLEYVCLKR